MPDSNKTRICLKIFFSFLKIGAFTFGGGFAMIPLIEKEVVDKHKWMSAEEFMDMLVVTQCSPGPVAVNAAVFIGYKIAGIMGAIVSLLGVVLPSFLIILLLAAVLLQQGNQDLLKKFFEGAQPAVVALILGAGINMGRKSVKSSYDYLVVFIAFMLLILTDVHPFVLIIAGAISGIVSRNFVAKGER